MDSNRKTAKRLIKIAKKNPKLYTKEDVLYAKMYRRKVKKTNDKNWFLIFNLFYVP